MAKTKFNLMDTLNSVSRERQNSTKPDASGGADIFKPQMISVHNLTPSAENFYDTSDVRDLKQSIELFGGIKQNLIVKPGEAGKFEVISGHRRRKACLELLAEGKLQFEFVPCIVEDGKDPLIEQLLLIMTNSTARELSDWEKCRQAEQLKTLLGELKRRDNIPGRVRELVAQALNVSESQVARYDAINANLAEDVKPEFASGNMPVSVAYEVSRKPKEKQGAAVEEYKTAKTTAPTVKIKTLFERVTATPEALAKHIAKNYRCTLGCDIAGEKSCEDCILEGLVEPRSFID
jgi:ParB family chromosome partitioning protein